MKLSAIIIEDEKLVAWSLGRYLEKQNIETRAFETGKPGIEFALENPPTLLFVDYRLPDQTGIEILMALQELRGKTNFFFMTAYGSSEVEEEAERLGITAYFNKPLDFNNLQPFIEQLQKDSMRIKTTNNQTNNSVEEMRIGDYVTQSLKMQQIFHTVQKLVMVEAGTILLLGETGTGKDTLAKVIHEHSPRKNKPFIIVNCASLQETLLESELFGYEKGAFTDAKNRKPGQLELADGGTVFLDEIGEIPFNFQAKLLRFIETQTFYRTGGIQEQKVNVRIVASTNKNLRKEMENENFRQDLFFRLNVITLTIPPLRERKEDIPLLLNVFIDHFNKEFKMDVKGYKNEVLEMLMQYSWPGNIRELKNTLERIFLLENPTLLETWHFPQEMKALIEEEKDKRCECFAVEMDDLFNDRSFADMEEMMIRWILQKENGNQSKSAARLKLTREQMRYKMKKYGLLP